MTPSLSSRGLSWSCSQLPVQKIWRIEWWYTLMAQIQYCLDCIESSCPFSMDTLNTTDFRCHSSTNYLRFVTMKYSTLVSLLLYFTKKNKQHVLDPKILQPTFSPDWGVDSSVDWSLWIGWCPPCWKKSGVHHWRLVVHPIIYRAEKKIPGDAEFPNHQQV